jgi:hypothetical protein
MDEDRVDEGSNSRNLNPTNFGDCGPRRYFLARRQKEDEADKTLIMIREKFEDGNAYQIAEVYALSGEIATHSIGWTALLNARPRRYTRPGQSSLQTASRRYAVDRSCS